MRSSCHSTMKFVKCIVALALLLAVTAHASIVISQESSSTSFYQTPWAGRLRNNDLINRGTASLGTGHTLGPVSDKFPVSGINDGTSADLTYAGNTWIQGSDFSGGINGTWVGTFHLNTTVNTRGYEITSIESFIGWGNQGSRIQGNQTYTVAVRTVGGSTYKDIATVSYIPFTTDLAGTNYETHVVLTENTSGILASGVDRIRFTFLNPHASVADNPTPSQGGTLIRELDVHGYPTGSTPPGPEGSAVTKPLAPQAFPHDHANMRAVMNGAADTGSSAFRQSSWFTPLGITTQILAFICAAGFFLQIRNRRQIRRLEELHALAAERTRIARDLHDDLGAGLTQVVLLSEMARNESGEPERAKAHNEQVFTVARRLARSLDEIVWAINPKNDPLEDSLSFVCKFSQDFLRSAGIACRLDWPEDLSDGLLTSSQRHQLYQAVREALNNVVKHATATEVRLRLTVSHSDLVVEISDNGCGFVVPPKSARSSRHGLDGMAERMKAAGGDSEITSEPGQGTLVRLRMPVR